METIELVNDGTGLGFGIVGGKTTGVIVKTIVPGGIADQVIVLMQCCFFWELVFRRFSIKQFPPGVNKVVVFFNL